MIARTLIVCAKHLRPPADETGADALYNRREMSLDRRQAVFREKALGEI
jgi:hypothetical protein